MAVAGTKSTQWGLVPLFKNVDRSSRRIIAPERARDEDKIVITIRKPYFIQGFAGLQFVCVCLREYLVSSKFATWNRCALLRSADNYLDCITFSDLD